MLSQMLREPAGQRKARAEGVRKFGSLALYNQTVHWSTL